MVKGEKWVMGGKELWHLFFLEKKSAGKKYLWYDMFCILDLGL
jgi:hypothetical protein